VDAVRLHVGLRLSLRLLSSSERKLLPAAASDGGAGSRAGRVLYLPPMAGKTATLDTILSTVERGFAAVASDIADIKSTMATKEDVRAIVNEELAPIHTELKSISDYLNDLTEKFENISGFRKEIDHALERIAAIEKHLKIDKKIAA
jgi:hypothetical protein